MNCNVGTADRIFRIIAGIVAGVLGIVLDSWWGLVGLIPLLTGIFKWCPLYVPFKISTLKKGK